MPFDKFCFLIIPGTELPFVWFWLCHCLPSQVFLKCHWQWSDRLSVSCNRPLLFHSLDWILFSWLTQACLARFHESLFPVVKRLWVDIVLAAQFCRAYAGSDWFQHNLDLLLWCKFARYPNICPPVLSLMYIDASVLLPAGSPTKTLIGRSLNAIIPLMESCVCNVKWLKQGWRAFIYSDSMIKYDFSRHLT